LCDPAVVPNEEHRRWLKANCDRILHCAASMTFREDKNHEPFRTNVDGVRALLELCRATEIRKFHHVSTAYICGLRNGRIFEQDIDVGQENGNVYEVSKLAAEKMIRAAEWIDELTVYRPASVVGDSRSGYTTSSHGFYLPLQLAYVMADKIPTRLMGERFFRLLGLRGDEGKNLVPVDWLSAGIVHLVNHSEHHGATYHMSHPHPVSVWLIQKVVQEAIEQFSSRRFMGELSEETIVEYERLFLQYMDIYRSHWRDDPTFDRTNTDRALAHLPCPEIDHDMLLRIAGYPIKENFILNRMTPAVTGFQPQQHLQGLASASRPVTAFPTGSDGLSLQVTGKLGGQWRLVIRDGHIAGVEQGVSDADPVRFHLNSQTFSSLVEGRYSAADSIRSGRVIVERDRQLSDEHNCVSILESIVSKA
jgi:nucleoside-diphosphate-sugar epimerase